MARRRYRRRRGGRNGRRKRGRARVLKITGKQARTKAYDSRIEHIIARVARTEDAKQKVKLLFRQYLFGPYNIDTNIWATSTRVSFAGHVLPLAAIQKVDNSTAVAVAPVANPYQTPTTHIPTGANVIANILSYDGYRRGNWVSLHGITVGFRGFVQGLSAVGSPLYEHARLYMEVALYQFENSDAVAAKPTINQCGIVMPLFGYSGKTDQTVWERTVGVKKRRLWHTTLKFRCNTLNTDLKQFTKYIDLSKKPVRLVYADQDQNGQAMLRWKPFLILKCDIPDLAALEPYMPQVNMFTKCHYTDT